MSEKRKGGFLLPVAVTVGVLFGIYAATYYAAVDTRGAYDGRQLWIDPHYLRLVPSSVAHKEPCNNAIGIFFSPLHWVDRRLRPETWKPSKEQLEELRRNVGGTP